MYPSMPILFLLFLIIPISTSTTPSDAHPLLKSIQSQIKESKNDHLKEIFSLYTKMQKKVYKSINELNYRMKIFRENLNQFIMPKDDILDRIKIEQDKEQTRIIIIPDKRLSVDFNTDYDDQDASIFELNKFSDLTNEEFENLFLLDQSFFDENKFPTNVAKDDDNFDGIKTIQRYLNKLEQKGVQISKDIKNFYLDIPKTTDSATLSHTPHFSTLETFPEES